MRHIYITYISLLADIRRLARVPTLGTPAEDECDWLLVEAPKLDKALLEYLKSDFTVIPDLKLWPRWLQPLWLTFHEGKSPIVLRYLRQALLFCYKAELPYTHEQETEAYNEWISVNDRCANWTLPVKGESRRVLNLAKCIVQDLLRPCDWSEVIPHHGPGAVTNGHQGQKGLFRNWYKTIDEIYPYHSYFGVSNIFVGDNEYEQIETPDYIEGKLICVPKTIKGPRLICVHPEESIWIQQGVRHVLESACRRNLRYVSGPRGFVNFNDQTVNGALALTSSKDGRFATIDLKSASDSLSKTLVEFLFGEYYKYVSCSRAEHISVPDEGGGRKSHSISAFAPMGNALTFPVQSICYWALCVATMHVLAPKSEPKICYVFGDDILVPTECASLVCEALQLFGLVVNDSKTFLTGHFRESCGIDAFNGVDVTPLKWRTTSDVITLASLQSSSTLAQRLREMDFYEASVTLYAIMATRLRALGRHLPVTNNPQHGGIAEYCPTSLIVWERAVWHRSYQWFGNYILRLTSRSYECEHGWNHVLSSLTSLERTGLSCDPASAVSRRHRLKRDWVGNS